jgi:hypothetical protein
VMAEAGPGADVEVPPGPGHHAERKEEQAIGEDAGIDLVFPTVKTLEALAGVGAADELLSWAQGREVEPIEPVVVIEGEIARVVLPGEPGYHH